MNRREIIRTIYLYLFSLVGLVLVVIGSVRIVDLGLKIFVFKNAEQTQRYPDAPQLVERTGKEEAGKISDEDQEKFKKDQEEYQKKELEGRRDREAASAVAMIIVGAPLFLYHWNLVQRVRRDE